MKRTVFVVLGLVVVVIAASTLAWVVTDDGDKKIDEAAKPLLATASTFVPPSGAAVSMDDTTTSSPPSAVRGWRSTGTIDEACAQWREAYRTWMGQTEFGAVTGQAVNGQSCSLEGRKNGHMSRLFVAVYGAQPPQATLTVTQ